MPRKIRPRRRKREYRQHHIPGPNENVPGIDLRPREMRRTPVKHPQPPQLPQHPQHPRPAANKNSSWVNPWNQPDPGRLYKQAPRSRGKKSTKRSRRDYFSGSSRSFNSKRPRRDYFSGSSSRVCKGPNAELVPQPQTPQGCTQAGPQGRAIALQQSGCHSEPYLPQSPLRAALPDSVIEVGLEPPVAASTFRVRTCLQSYSRSPVGLQNSRSSLNHTGALTCLASGSNLLLGVQRGQGLSHLPLLAVLESTSPPSGGGMSNDILKTFNDCIPLPVQMTNPFPKYNDYTCKRQRTFLTLQPTIA